MSLRMLSASHRIVYICKHFMHGDDTECGPQMKHCSYTWPLSLSQPISQTLFVSFYFVKIEFCDNTAASGKTFINFNVKRKILMSFEWEENSEIFSIF